MTERDKVNIIKIFSRKQITCHNAKLAERVILDFEISKKRAGLGERDSKVPIWNVKIWKATWAWHPRLPLGSKLGSEKSNLRPNYEKIPPHALSLHSNEKIRICLLSIFSIIAGLRWKKNFEPKILSWNPNFKFWPGNFES